MKGKNKKGIETEMLIGIIIMVVVLVIMITSFIFLKAKGISAVDFIKNLFRFRG